MAARLAVLALLAAALAQGPSNGEDERLAEAEALARKGRYEQAVRAYRRLAEEAPGTPVGEVALRRSAPSAFCGWTYLTENGPSENRVDVVLMGDGYELDHQKTFDGLARRIPPLFARQDTFREYESYLNFVRVNLISAESGVDGFGREYDTALNAETLSTFAGHVGIDTAAVHRMLAELPSHDSLAIVFVKNGVLGTGGGGIATIGGGNFKTTVHEFGHAFAGLGDEYASRTHEGRTARAAANVALTDDLEQVPWKHFVEAGVKGIGAYEGASGQVRGAWRPTAAGCVMESGDAFCPVCREAIVLRIYASVDPIDGCEPGVLEELALGGEGLEFEVRVMQPESHDLEVAWWVVPEEQAPRGATGSSSRRTRVGSGRSTSGRRRRGLLPRIAADPRVAWRSAKKGLARFELEPGALGPGRWRVIARARDTARWRGERTPWVIRDEHGLLSSERSWRVVVEP